MDTKRKDKLLKIYDEISDDRERYIKLYKSTDEFQFELEKMFDTHINVQATQDKQIDVCLKLLPLKAQTQIVHLGYMEAIRSNDYSYLNKALNTYSKLKMIVILQTSSDHCYFSLDQVPYLFVLKKFDLLEKIYPKDCGLSKAKIWGGIVTNLIMYLYYREESWKEQALNDADKYLSRKSPLEYHTIAEALVALVNKDFEQFSLSLNDICKGRKKSKEFGENKFSRSVSFYSLGLYNFAQYLYPDESNKITLPDDDAFLTDYHLYQESHDSLDDGYIINFNEKLSLLKAMFEVDTPCISLTKNNGRLAVDYISYNDAVIKKIKALL